MSISNPSLVQLKRAIEISEQIQKLENELRNVLGNASAESAIPAATTKKPKAGKRTFSAEARAKMAAAQKARWAKSRGSKAESKKATRK